VDIKAVTDGTGKPIVVSGDLLWGAGAVIDERVKEAEEAQGRFSCFFS
jgi:hypothetical protein